MLPNPYGTVTTSANGANMLCFGRPRKSEAQIAWEPDIWTMDVRRVVYKRLVQKFGPYDVWEKTSSPGRNLDAEFEKFCEEFARVVGAKSGKAVATSRFTR